MTCQTPSDVVFERSTTELPQEVPMLGGIAGIEERPRQDSNLAHGSGDR
jgi:hypothetical protein